MQNSDGGVSLTLAVVAIALAAYLGWSYGHRSEREDAYKAMRAKIDHCTKDCSGHKAGYAWAEDNGIEDPDECPWATESFHNGCLQKAYDDMEADAEASRDWGY